MSEDSQGKATQKKGRSPSYPAIDLQAAIRRAESIYAHEKMHPAPIGAIVSHWGYTTHKSGIASVQYASLKKFGLLIEQGSGDSRLGQLTPLAFAILHNPNEAERAEAIKTAALTPSIHRELWDQYGLDLPSDANLRYRLVVERGFTDAGAEDFVKQFKSTLGFAMAESSSDETDEVAGSNRADDLGSASPARTAVEAPAERLPTSDQPKATVGPKLRRHAIPLVGGKQVVLEGEFPLTEAAWSGFLAVLEAFKPGLVDSPTDSEHETE